MTPMRLLPEAEEELQDAARFYEAEQQGLGRALIQEVRRACRFIAEQPMAARIERGEVRVRTSVMRLSDDDQAISHLAPRAALTAVAAAGIRGKGSNRQHSR